MADNTHTDDEELRLSKELLHDLRMLSEKYFGNETYGKYLPFNHDLQRLLEKHLAVPTKSSGELEDLREELIDKLDDQRFGDNIVSKKLLYKDIEWIVNELLPVFTTQTTKLQAETEQRMLDAIENTTAIKQDGRILIDYTELKARIDLSLAVSEHLERKHKIGEDGE